MGRNAGQGSPAAGLSLSAFLLHVPPPGGLSQARSLMPPQAGQRRRDKRQKTGSLVLHELITLARVCFGQSVCVMFLYLKNQRRNFYCHVCVCMCMSVGLSVCPCLCVYMHDGSYAHLYMCICVLLWMYMSVWCPCVFVSLCIYACVSIDMYVSVYVCYTCVLCMSLDVIVCV